MNRVERLPDRVAVENVLVSTFEKKGLDTLVSAVRKRAPRARFFATGGTYRELQSLLGSRSEALVALTDYTGQPEMEGGLVKSLDYKIYLGLLSEPFNAAHDDDVQRTGALRFDLVVCNLYPFQDVVANAGDIEAARANIDIGGPTMIRAAAKNFHRVAVLCSPEQYPRFEASLESDGALPLKLRYELAREAFAYSAQYEAAISSFFEQHDPNELEGIYTVRSS